MPWLDRQETRLRRACPEYTLRDAELRAGIPESVGRTTRELRWERQVPVETAVLDISSRSPVALLPEKDRAALLDNERDAPRSCFSAGEAAIPYVLVLNVARSG